MPDYDAMSTEALCAEGEELGEAMGPGPQFWYIGGKAGETRALILALVARLKLLEADVNVLLGATDPDIDSIRLRAIRAHHEKEKQE